MKELQDARRCHNYLLNQSNPFLPLTSVSEQRLGLRLGAECMQMDSKSKKQEREEVNQKGE